jgi:hypothetical protein
MTTHTAATAEAANSSLAVDRPSDLGLPVA